MQKKRQHVLICLVLIFATAAVYGQVSQFEFVCYDDDTYVINNPHVTAGLSWAGLRWAFTACYAGTWQPLTWLSFMLDYELYGLAAGGYHSTNLLLHIANTLLLYAAFVIMRAGAWRSGFVAALFALHPLHVESVAWVAERKDVLSTLFWMLTLLGYLRFTARPGLCSYLVTAGCYTLGLLAKPMLVTLPFALLLLDWWPLGRWPNAGAALRRLLEKLPLMGLAAASAVVTFFAQQRGGAIGSLEAYPLAARLANALVSYAAYLCKMLWPFNLAALYPHPGMPAWWQTAGACLVLGAATALALGTTRRHPALLTGWLWYLGTLVPVIGLVQIGLHAMADRFTYVPLIGIFIMIAWGVPGLLSGWRHRSAALAWACPALLILLAISSWHQAGHWRTSLTLFEHALGVTAGNFVAHNNLGIALAEQGRRAEAVQHYAEALRINSAFAEANNNLGFELARQGRLDDAITYYARALRASPQLAKTHYNLAHALSERGRKEEAVQHYAEALRLKPDFTKAHINLGLLLADGGQRDEALRHYQEALRLDPQRYEAHFNLGLVLAQQGRLEEAIGHYTQALQGGAHDAQVHSGLGLAYLRQDRTEEAIRCFRRALELAPGLIEAHHNLGAALSQQGHAAEAISHYEFVVRAQPASAEARNNLGAALARLDRLEEAIQQYAAALELGRDNADIYVNLASALAKTGRLSEAIAHLREAVRLRPDDTKALNNLGAMLMHAGQNAEAAACFRRVLHLDPEHALARDNLGKLMAGRQAR